MAPVVVPGVCRFTVNQRMGGHVVNNILDFQIDTTGTVGSRSDEIFGLAGDIINNWDDHIRPMQSPALVCESVSWVDLDNLDGETGSRSTTSATTWPAEGGGQEPGFPGNVALLVTKRANGGRRSRNGRLYLAGYFETSTPEGDPNQITTADQAVAQELFNSFLSGVNDIEGGAVETRAMVVVHEATTPPTYDVVENLVVQRTLATQRRRLRD